MSDSRNNPSALNDEQIENLVREFSQYEEDSQMFFESQTQNFCDEQLQQQRQSPPDFQAEFLKSMFNADEIECLARTIRANGKAGTQNDYESQTDVETVVTTYMTYNPNLNEDFALKPLDIEAYLQTRDFFVTIKTGTSNDFESNQNQNKRDNRFKLGPLPLEIDDLHRIAINANDRQPWNSYQKIYGQTFKTVMFYGRCKPCGISSLQKNRNVRLYEVDDGTGMIIVHFAHCDTEYLALRRGIERLTEDYELALREGIPYLGGDDFQPNSSKCKEMLQNIKMMINIIRRDGAITQDFFANGSKVCVIGRVFSHSDGTNHVFAYHMLEDASKNREFEIKYKNHLISEYELKYLKYKIDGTRGSPETEMRAKMLDR